MRCARVIRNMRSVTRALWVGALLWAASSGALGAFNGPEGAHTCAAGGETWWTNDFSEGLDLWGALRDSWGRENIRFLIEPGLRGKVMRVQFPRGSYDPGTMRRLKLPMGGAGFKAAVLAEGRTCAFLAYVIRFPEGFDFVKGGKLPGLFGGKGNSGWHVPTGYDGFSTRYMWGRDGFGQVYAYTPESVKHGTALLRRQFRFVPGRWHVIQQQIILNEPGKKNGIVRVWLDGKFRGEETNLRFRDTEQLTIDGIFFDTFFGGGDPSWATPMDTHIDFAAFIISNRFIEVQW